MQHSVSRITAIVLTYNEEKHIERCLKSLLPYCCEIYVVDSFSTDRTCKIAEGLGAKVVGHEFKNQAQQFNWAIDNLDIVGGWIWRVDADEYISKDLGEKVNEAISTCADAHKWDIC